MDDARWERWATLTGIGFVAALVTAYVIAPAPPKLSARRGLNGCLTPLKVSDTSSLRR